MLSKKEVQHIAELARLGITDKEAEKFRKELSSILDYVEKLKKADVASAEPTSHPLDVENVMRKDEAKKEKNNLLDLAPQTKNNCVKVKSILK